MIGSNLHRVRSMKRMMSMPGAQYFLMEIESDFDEAFLRHVLLDQ